MSEFKLSSRPDGFGFFYGWVERNGEHVRVDVLPPAPLWEGDFRNPEPDPEAWVVYFDGEEFARVGRREDLVPLITGKPARLDPA